MSNLKNASLRKTQGIESNWQSKTKDESGLMEPRDFKHLSVNEKVNWKNKVAEDVMPRTRTLGQPQYPGYFPSTSVCCYVNAYY